MNFIKFPKKVMTEDESNMKVFFTIPLKLKAFFYSILKSDIECLVKTYKIG